MKTEINEWNDIMPTVSVVLPTYQHKTTVGKAIQSVLDQTYQDFELIIIDDASTDGTEQILKEFQQKDERIQIYRNEKNSGLPAKVCNEAVSRYANGQWIAFQFDDDYWFEWCLESLVGGVSNFDLVYGQSLYITYPNKRLRGILGTELIDKNNIAEKNSVANNAVLIKKSVFLKENGFNEEFLLRRVCDWELWIRLVYHEYRIGNLPQLISVCFACHPNSVGLIFPYDISMVRAYINKKIEEMTTVGMD